MGWSDIFVGMYSLKNLFISDKKDFNFSDDNSLWIHLTHLSPFPPFGTLLKKEVAKSYQFSVCSLYVKARYFSPLYLVSNSFASFTKYWSSSFSYYFEPKTLGKFLWQHLCSANLRIGFMPRIIQSLPAPFHSLASHFKD